jgi:acetylornithine deacetylase
VNAIHSAAKIITRLEELAEQLVRRERPHPGFDVPHSTVQVNRIRGGNAGNTVAGACSFTIDFRHLPWTKREELIEALRTYVADSVLPPMRRLSADCSVEIEELADVPAFSIAETDPLVRTVQQALESTADCSCVAFGTEAGHFQSAGIPTLVCGPGSIEQAHRPDEFVTLDQLDRCERALRRLVLAGGTS